MALIGQSSVLSKDLPRNKNFHRLVESISFLFCQSAVLWMGVSHIVFWPHILWARLGMVGFLFLFFMWLNCFSDLSVYPGSDR